MREYRHRQRLAAMSSASQFDPSSDPLIAFTDRHAWLPYALALVCAIACFVFIHHFGLPSDPLPPER
jgi:hypothetical protein